LTRKKNEDIVPDSDSTYSKNELLRRKVYEEIRQLYGAGYSSRKIAKLLQVSRNTISKVLHGDINELCRNSRALMLDKYLAEIINGINAGHTGKVIYQELKSDGKDPGGISNFYVYLNHIAKSLGLTLEKFSHQPVPLSDNTVPEKDFDYLKRTGVFQYLWNESELTEKHRKYLFEKYPVVPELRKRVLEFREIFIRKKPYLLYLFIDNCLASSIPKLVAFVKGLQQDIEAVENAVTSDLSNGFVEGTNNKIKMVKRVMYGRCGIRLLKAKLIYQSLMNNYG
jgi:predicted XRE-type DNA-binding protein